ncbi:MAG: GAF domain-containing protein [Calditrichaeota bacterium]|nr:MAG: GAF domain-containing protein [Calditrichota bacterium]
MMNNKELEALRAENERLKKTVQDLWTLNQLAHMISSTMPVNEILDNVVGVALKAINAEQGTISLLEEKKEDDTFKTMIRKVDASRAVGQYRLNDHLSGWMLRNRKALVINDVKADPGLKGVQLAEEIESLLSVPMLCKGKLIGVLNVFNKKGRAEFSKDDQRLLSIIASQSAQVIENARLYQEEKQLRRYEQEMEMARQIQQSLLPASVPQTEKLELASYFKPADQVGGDYFDYLELGEGRIAVVLADVSGHGAAAALLMTMVKGILHALSKGAASPVNLLAEINAVMNDIAPSDKFVTIALLIFDLKKMQLHYANAGHPPLLFLDSDKETCEFIELLCPAVGLSERSAYREELVPIKPGDLFLLYTDGVTEAFGQQREMFGEERLKKALDDGKNSQPDQVLERIKQRLQTFIQAAPQSDDVAMIAIRVR